MKKVLIFLLMSLFSVGHTMGKDMPASSASVYHIDKDQLENIAQSANDGDIESSLRLYRYYTFSRYDEALSRQWLEHCAHLGNPTAQYNLAIFLFEEKKYGESLKWAIKSKENGHDGAVQLIEKIRLKKKH